MRMAKQNSFHAGAKDKSEKKGMLAIPSKEQKRELKKRFMVNDDDDDPNDNVNNDHENEEKKSNDTNSPQDSRIFSNSPILRGYVSDSAIKRFESKPKS